MTKTQEVAREAARLLYSGVVEEYKEAKIAASEAVGIRSLPSNFDVALELSRLADELEGEQRKELIVRLRQEALNLMVFLDGFHPRLFGSVWRGTVRKGSDIDIQVYAPDAETVVRHLRESYEIAQAGWTNKTTGGCTVRFFHIFLPLPSGNVAEVSVKSSEERGEVRVDAIYGDHITGLGTTELRDVLEKGPLRTFVPERKKRRTVHR